MSKLIEWLKRNSFKKDVRTNRQGNEVESRSCALMDCDRYVFDFELCMSKDGWKQYDTEQDACYFGVWVHIEERKIVTYAEGDVSIVTCPDVEHLKAELKSMADFYGDPPPAFRVISAEGITLHYDERPAVEE